jgi:hypothetical protein
VVAAGSKTCPEAPQLVTDRASLRRRLWSSISASETPAARSNASIATCHAVVSCSGLERLKICSLASSQRSQRLAIGQDNRPIETLIPRHDGTSREE